MLESFLTNLSQNYTEILKDDEYYDVEIEVGEDPDVKIFRAHMVILCFRSSFLRRTLASNKKDNDDLAHIKLTDISSETFQIILRYIYGGIISLDEQGVSGILELLAAADSLQLQELVDWLQHHLSENESMWAEKYFELTSRTSLRSDSLSVLQQSCMNIVVKSPEKVFNSSDFASISENSLISIIKQDSLQMNEVEIWEYILKWGLEKNPKLTLDPSNWSDEDFKMMGNILQNFLPLVRFFSLSSEDFLQKIRPYQKLLNQQLYDELLESYLNPNSEPSDNILLPRYKNIDETIETEIVNINIASIISRWIDRLDNNTKYTYARELHLPYKFKLLLRGSRDGFSPNTFHKLCDNIPNTVTFIKVKDTEEIIGGYNPLMWKNSLPVTNYESMANQVMPDLGQEIEDFTYSTWQIVGWSNLLAKKVITGPEFKVGGRKWCIVLYLSDEHVSVYLALADQKKTPLIWHACVQFALVMWNPKDPTQYVIDSATHRFTAKEQNWGFNHFYESKYLFTTFENRTRPLIENNSINITAFVRVFKDPTGNLWVDNIPKLKNEETIHEICETKDSFIFSFKDKDNFKDNILSRVKNIGEALIHCSRFGPAFNNDLLMGVKEEDGLKEYDLYNCIQESYEKKIRDSEDSFLIEDYEVFQIIWKK